MASSRDGDRIRAAAADRTALGATSVRRALTRIRPQLTGSEGPWPHWLASTVTSPVAAQQPDVAAFVESINAQLLCSVVSVADSSEAVTQLLRGGIPVQLSALVAARTALEAASNAHHLLSQVPQDGDEFIARALEMAWQSQSAERPLLPMGQEIGMLPQGHGHRARTTLTAASAAQGWRPRFSKSGQFQNLHRPNGEARPRPGSATARIEAACEQDGVHAWRITSGAAHGMPWMQVHEITSPDRPMPGAPGLTASACVLEAVRVLLSAAAEPFGDPEMSRAAQQAQAQKHPPEVGHQLLRLMSRPESSSTPQPRTG